MSWSLALLPSGLVRLSWGWGGGGPGGAGWNVEKAVTGERLGEAEDLTGE